MKKLFTLTVLLCLFIGVAFGQSITMTNTGSGNDSDPVVVSITSEGAPDDATITSLSITTYMGTNVPSWYNMHLTIGTTTYDNVGNLTNAIYNDLNGQAVNGHTITITSLDTDDYADGTTMNLSVVFNYMVAGAPDLATNPSPVHNATNVPVSGNLTWDFGANTDTYDLWFGPTGNMTQVVSGGTAEASGSYIYADLQGNTNYQWRVDTIGSSTTQGTVWNFKTEIQNAVAAVYTSGNIPTTYNNSVNLSSAALEPGILTVTIPDGKRIASVDVEYQMAAVGGGWISEQRSFLKCATNGTTEAQVYSGSGNTTGTYSYNRTGLSVGQHLAGNVTFELHAFRTYGGSGSNTTYNYVVDGTWMIVVHYEDIPAQPVFNVAPTSWDYGVIDIAGTGATKVFTISNSGAGDMNISSISVTGDYYRVTDEPDTYPVVVTSATPINFTVSYAPTVAGEHAGTVTIMQDGVEHTVTLTGEGFTRPAGSTVQNPLVVTLPVEGYTGNTEAYGNDYLSTWVTPSSSYLNGYDFVAQFTLDVESYVSGSALGSYIGLFIVAQEPDATTPAPRLAFAGTSSGGTISDVVLPAGTYYAIVSTWPTPNYTDFTLNLSAVAAPTEPEFAVSPEIKDFGSLALGATSAPQVFTITNVGGGTLVLDPAISIGGEHADQFTLIDTNEYPKNLGLNQSMTVSVTFNPTSAGEKQGTLIINDNLAGDKSFTITRSTKNGSKVENSVTLTGIGVDTTIYERDLPYAQNFDSVTVPDLPLGWSKIQSSTSTSAYVRTISTTTPYSNPNHAAMYNIYTADVLILTTPMIDASLNSLRMSYWAKRGSSAESVIIGTMSDPTDPATFTPLQTVALTATYTQYFYDFGAYEGEDDYIAFKHAATATYRYVYLDNVIIELIPSDPVFAVTPELKVFANQQIGTESAAQQFTVTNTGPGILTINEVSVTGPDADQFILVDENAYGFDIGAEANENLIVSVKFAPTTVGDKTANLRIVDSLSKEEHLVPLSGNGFDATIYAPHVQNFSGTFPPANWTRHDQRLTGSIATGNTGSQWGQDDWLNITSPVNKAAKINVYGTTRNGWLITPPISIPDGNYELKFDLALLKWNQTPTGTAPDQNGTDDRFIVLIGNGSNWEAANIVREWNNSGSEYVYNGIAISGETVTIPLADYVGTKYIAFYAESTVSNADNDLMIDNFKIVPINTDAAPIVGGEADLTPPPVTPEGGGDPINPTVEITGLTGEGTVAVTAGYNPEDVTLPNVGLALTFSGTNFAGSTITINHGLGFMPAQIAYRVIPGGWILLLSNDPSVLTWDATTVSFTTAAKAAGDLQVVFPQQQNQTLPVELSSFTAVLTADMFVNIAWVAESETNHLGYNILRSQVKDLDTALMLNPAMINEGSAAGTQMSYIYTDKEVYNNNVYYYWLESVAIDGSVQYAGPLTITLGDPNYEPPTPEIPVRTALMSAYPNPFNPQTNLRYSLKEAGDVQIGVYNMKGQLIRSYSRSHNVPGYYSVVWDGKDSNGKLVSSGVYFYRMNSGSYSATRKMMLMK